MLWAASIETASLSGDVVFGICNNWGQGQGLTLVLAFRFANFVVYILEKKNGDAAV